MKKLNKLNVQALAIKEPRLVKNIVSNEGYSFIGEDLISAEPMITALLSNDQFYSYAVYDGIGKRPFYKKGVLMVSDVYIMFASCNPITASKVKDLFDADEWMRDPEAVKKKLKEVRNLCKVLVLAASYGCGVNKMHTIFRERGYNLSKKEVEAAFHSYWDLFRSIKMTIKYLEEKCEKDGYLVNWFGYRIAPEKPRNAFNYFCQSTVSGLFNFFMQTKFELAKDLDHRFVTCIHDALVTEVNDRQIELSREVTNQTLVQVNNELAWRIPVRTDFNVSKNFYGLKE